MTNREAAEIMKAIIFMLKNDDYSDEVEQAIHMAINALTAQEQLAKNSSELDNKFGDLISRQAATDAVRELYIQSPKISNDIVYDMAIDQAHDALVKLPSAQPDLEEDEDIPMEYFENGGI